MQSVFGARSEGLDVVETSSTAREASANMPFATPTRTSTLESYEYWQWYSPSL